MTFFSRPLAPVSAQGRSGRSGLASLWELDRLHDLADHAVGDDGHRLEVLVGQVKGLDDQVHRFLHRRRRQDDEVIVAVTAAFGHLEVVALGGLDVAQARARRA